MYTSNHLKLPFFRLGICIKITVEINFAASLKTVLPTFEGYVIISDQIHNFPIGSKKYMVVDDNSFQVMKDGSLNVTLANGKSRIYQQYVNGEAQYCLDLVTEKCNYKSFLHLAPINALILCFVRINQ